MPSVGVRFVVPDGLQPAVQPFCLRSVLRLLERPALQLLRLNGIRLLGIHVHEHDHSDKYLCGLGLDFWCSTTYLCNTMDECDSGHLFTCDTAFQCQGMNFTCSSGKTGITTCGAPNPNYFTNGNPNPQNFNCGSILGTGDQFNCWSTFTCSAGAQFQCTSNTAFACVMLQFTCADNTQFLCPPPGFNCPVPPNSFGCPFTSGNYFCNTRGGWGCGVNQQDGTYGCAAGGLGQFQCVPSDGGTFLPYYCAPQNGGYTCTWQANGFWCTPLRGDYICAPNPKPWRLQLHAEPRRLHLHAEHRRLQMHE